MYQKYVKMILVALVVSASISAYSQVVPAAQKNGPPLTVGVGFSDYYTDWNGRLAGPMLWADWNFYHVPSLLRGFGIEAEGRDLNFGRTGTDPKLRMDTFAGGAIYTWRHYDKFHPYAKFLVGYGSHHFSELSVELPNYTHDSRTVVAPGAGLDYRVTRDVWVRGNYEYQFWLDYFNHHALNPNGFTIGVAYDLRNIHRR
jgi:hypothetical protein